MSDLESLRDYWQLAFTKSFTTHAQVDIATQEFQQQLEILQAKLLALRTTRNTLSPVNRLPPEVLGDIFVALVQSYAEHEYYDLSLFLDVSKLFQWIVVTTVCRHWREVALSTPEVWSFIPLQNSWWHILDQLLKRSANVPLTMIQSNYGARVLHRPLKDILFARFDRVHTLALAFHEGMLECAEELGGLDSPHLDTLHIGFIYRFDERWLSTLATAAWPRLRILECVGGGYMHLRSVLRPTVTSLIVYRPWSIDTEDFLNCLATLPNLQSLSLVKRVEEPEVPTYQTPPSRTLVTLPNLRKLFLEDDGSGVATAHFLNQLPTLPYTTIRLRGSRQAVDPEDAIPFIVRALADKANSRAAKYLDFYDAREGFPVIMKVCSPAGPENTSQSQSSTMLPLVTELLLKYPVDYVVDMFVTHYPLSTVRRLYYTARTSMATETWRLLSEKLHSLEELGIILFECNLEFMAIFLRVLEEPLAFPSLQTLRLRYMVWYQHHANQGESIEERSLLSSLFHALKQRLQRGQPIRKLRLYRTLEMEDCDKELKQLAKVVEKFKCIFRDPAEERCTCEGCSKDQDTEGEGAEDDAEGVENEGGEDEDAQEDEDAEEDEDAKEDEGAEEDEDTEEDGDAEGEDVEDGDVENEDVEDEDTEEAG